MLSKWFYQPPQHRVAHPEQRLAVRYKGSDILDGEQAKIAVFSQIVLSSVLSLLPNEQ